MADYGEDVPEGAEDAPFIVFDGYPGLSSGANSDANSPLCSPIKYAGLQESAPFSRRIEGGKVVKSGIGKVMKIGADNYNVTV